MPSLVDTNDSTITVRPKKQPQPSAQFQSVFRLKQPLKHNTVARTQNSSFQLAQSSLSSFQDGQAQQYGFHSRRSHRKSRLGCGNCKKRRVKCDETKPECTRCFKYGVTCDFSSDSSSHNSNSSSDSDGNSPSDFELVLGLTESSPDMAASSMSLAVVERNIAHIVGLDHDRWSCSERMVRLGLGDGSSQLVNLSVLYNFIMSTETIPDEKMKKVIKTGLIQTAFGSAHLMHTILAASYLHMNHARRRNSYRRVQEAYHWQRAIQLYQVEMQNPIGAHNTNALMGSCIFMGINTLMPVGFQPQDSWVFTSDPADLNWLALQGGLRCMIELTQPFIADSIWGESFQASAERLKPFQDEVPGREGMHSALADLCEIDDATTPATNPYHWHVQLLSRMLMLKPFDRPDNYNVFVTWMGQILPEFITLLRGKDERAMLILSWWMALMCAMASFQVWIHARIVPECRAICMYLEQNSTDAEILRLMRWPAQACGYHEWMPETFEDVII